MYQLIREFYTYFWEMKNYKHEIVLIICHVYLFKDTPGLPF